MYNTEILQPEAKRPRFESISVDESIFVDESTFVDESIFVNESLPSYIGNPNCQGSTANTPVFSAVNSSCSLPGLWTHDDYTTAYTHDELNKDELPCTNETSWEDRDYEDGGTKITGLAAMYERQASQDLPASFKVHLDSSSRFTSKEYDFIRGRIQTQHAQLLEGMIDENTLDLYTICTVDARPVTKKRGRTHMLWPCTLDITVYGPFELFNELGNWFQDYEVHLQDPQVCHLDTKYCNPQRLSSVRPWPLVSEIVSQRLFLTPREIPERSNFLDILSSHVDLEETPQPLAIRTSLKRFLNTISRLCQPEEPLNFFGGIIADPMGFGKTLTVISLVATDKESGEMADICTEYPETHKPDVAATLVIIPPPSHGKNSYLTHFIRNGDARMARAVCDLEATSRWAVTGTPIQNRLGDLASLLKFIRAYPYTDPKHFDADVSRPWKSGEDEEAVKRLKRLLACLLLRRPKGEIDLPPRRDLRCAVDFTHEEREAYERIRHQTITSMNEAFKNNANPSRSHIYVNVLQQIETLRLFSNLGLHYFSRHTKPSQQSLGPEQWNHNAQRTFNSQREMTLIVCIQCSSALGLTETLLDDTAHPTESAHRGLEDEGIKSIRFDGKVPQKDRQSVLHSFNSDPNIRIMLLTLSCGAVGNPTLEEQALARIHRLGQSREVETVRFYVRNSFEEEVMNIQESKKQLAGVLLSPHDRESSSDNLKTLEYSRLSSAQNSPEHPRQ
ncbi:hypothetical protein FHL15_007493 [Xylaria flabelliformis]|uniref:SNF2 N-terminal domain-containing protein n=1 Tax=Xylaria flabelliformis TaxID=2512241 RepID=A0A553HUT5_9PEZI|nr:hypothetical protein FHL15_007493 [Xylaria flabelliformis]